MDFDGSDNNLDALLRTSPELRDFLQMVAGQGADYWRSNSVVDTGYNAEHVEALTDTADDGILEGIVHATGYYAEWRERGSSRAGPRAPEWVLRRFLEIVDG